MKSIVKLAELRDHGIEMFLEIIEVLNKYDLEYWLDYGTLLGAVREGMIIPWDGEFDISTWDDNINLESNMWKDIIKLGYSIDFGEYNIKILKKKCNIGAFKIDLHRYRRINNEAIYLYGKIPKTNIIIKSYLKLLNLLKQFLKVDDDYKCNFSDIYQLIQENLKYSIPGIDNKNIHFKFGKFYYEPFSIEIDNKKFQKRTLQNIKHPFSKFIISIISFLPLFLRIFIFKVLKIFHSKIDFTYNVTINVPNFYFNNLSIISFCGTTFKCPSRKEEYLKRVYGVDWRIPRSSWEISVDSPTYKKK